MEAKQSSIRDQALEQLKRKRDFRTHAATYVAVNALLWVIWAFSDAGDTNGIPWPAWVTVFWGFGLAMQAWNVYGERPISGAEVEEEMRRIQGGEGDS